MSCSKSQSEKEMTLFADDVTNPMQTEYRVNYARMHTS